ncbi:MAG: hypothetical protein COA83_00590 [Methylophaga sp.]|nr:MAG: hypothetical protein COA83_00590 [Methylophaga sp.]
MTKKEINVRIKAANRTDANAALEGLAPVTEQDGYAFELRQLWIAGKITSEKERELLLRHFKLQNGGSYVL